MSFGVPIVGSLFWYYSHCIAQLTLVPCSLKPSILRYTYLFQFYRELSYYSFLFLLDVCEPSWQQSRVGLITSQFAFSILVIVLGVFLPLILIIARKIYRHFHKKVRN